MTEAVIAQVTNLFQDNDGMKTVSGCSLYAGRVSNLSNHNLYHMLSLSSCKGYYHNQGTKR